MPARTYSIVSRYFVDGQGWTREHTEHIGDLYGAGKVASKQAHTLDAKYGDAHFWTVDLFHLADNGELDGLGSYYQLFHGRLS
jgi:hypothetical protein